MAVRRSLIVLMLLMLAVPVVVFSMRAGQAAAENPAPTLQLYTVQRGNVQLTISAIGTIEAEEIAELSFTTGGRVIELMIQEGDYVLAGDPLVRLEDEVERITYQQEVLNVQSAELRLQDLLDGPDEDDIRIAEANVDAAWGAYQGVQNRVTDTDLAAAQQRYEQAVNALNAANEARRLAGGSSDEAISLLDAQIGEASFNAEIARLQLERLQNSNGPDLGAAYARVLQQQAILEQVKSGATEEQIEQARIALEQAQTNLRQAEVSLNDRVISAPYDGYVSDLTVEVGALVAPGRPIISIADVTPLHMTVEVDEVDIRRIREGMSARAEIDALTGVELPATIEQIALVGQEEEGIVSYDVDLTLDNSDERVRTGMTAEAAVIVEEKQDVLVVPNQYVRVDRRTNRAFVNMINREGQIEEIEIELGLQGEETSEVVSGLNEGDVIAVDLAGERFSFFGGE
jgi:RND family efflux transporter MFP subunit